MNFGNTWDEHKDSTYHDEYMSRNTGVFRNQNKIIKGNSVQNNMTDLNVTVWGERAMGKLNYEKAIISLCQNYASLNSLD